MARVVMTEYGPVTYPGDGYAYRGVMYTPEFELLEGISPGTSGWSRLWDGTFRSTRKVETALPVYIRELIASSKWLVGGILGIFLLDTIRSIAKERK